MKTQDQIQDHDILPTKPDTGLSPDSYWGSQRYTNTSLTNSGLLQENVPNKAKQ